MLKDKYCRICMIATTSNKFFRIFETVKGNCLVANILADCANISVEIDDELPQIVCPTCLDNLIEFWKFRRLIKNTNRNLIKMLCNQPVIEPNPKVRIKIIDKFSDELEEDDFSANQLKAPMLDKIDDNDDMMLLIPESIAPRQMEKPNVRIELIKITTKKPKSIDTITRLTAKASAKTREIRSQSINEYFENDRNTETPILHYCCTCPMKFDDEKQLLEHVKTEHHRIRERFRVAKFYEEKQLQRCDLCLKIINKLKALNLHRDRFKTAEQCESCGKFMMPKSSQLKSIHTCSCSKLKNSKKKTREECPICHLTFTQLKTHIIVHESKTIQCKLCSQVLHNTASFAAHMNRHEMRLSGKTKCNFPGCDFMLYEPYRKRHMRSHTKETPYDCQYCEKKFTEYIDRKRHEWTHTGISPYMCSQCNKMFFRKSHLLKHEANCKIIAV